jgi:hypothetical protein
MSTNDAKEGKGDKSSIVVPIVVALISALVTIVVAFKDPITAILFPTPTPIRPSQVTEPVLQPLTTGAVPALQFEPCATNDYCTNYRQIKEVVSNPDPFPYNAEYSAEISSGDQIRFLTGWCAKDGRWLAEDLQHIQFAFVINGVSYQKQLGTETYTGSDSDFPSCFGAGIGVSGWQSGTTYRVAIGLILDADVFDGATTSPKGESLRTFVLTVK